ncbi:Mavicyanin [Heracleum sosnowskyi]|uniref:Mavicyanin n=1 Tax=Heracleum sosnowskyi TaxID=360622 RepID=A0AAD8J1N9_9APIA|nr:Mavicyanin [Heracleum sosnowskyi]
MGLERANVGVFIVVMICGCMQIGSGTVYKVGDSAGWTTIGKVDYKQWAATKTFKVNDVILFEYSSQFHNVMQVKHVHYKSCNASFPIATHTSGNDSITITRHGHHFFLCGVPGHCQAGQKVDINVLRLSSSLPPSSPPTALPTSSAIVPAPSSSKAAPFYALSWFSNHLWIVMAVVVALF